ncbi:hypothetical protein BHE74_00055710 [Ensete ventricosum]|nr:hypothetical protein BHE74_00055710 [Ensete ventricosum]RZS14054.1 hypothetical protein BHM03_00045724 [Ensete ventricosum]
MNISSHRRHVVDAFHEVSILIYVMAIAAFNYVAGVHTVDQVSATDYSSCSASNALSTDGSGQTTVKLSKAGTYYFICGVASHCSNGMKIAVPIKAASPAISPATPPSTSTKPPTAAATGTTPPSASTTPSDSTTPSTTTTTAAGKQSSAGYVSSASVGMLTGLLALELVLH